MRKYFYFKKYQDEVWGHLIGRYKFNEVKKTVLLKYKDSLLKNKTYSKTQFLYYRQVDFLRKLRTSLFNYNYFNKIKILKNFINKKKNNLNALNWKKQPISFSIIKTTGIRRVARFQEVQVKFDYCDARTAISKWKFDTAFWIRNRLQYLLKKRLIWNLIILSSIRRISLFLKLKKRKILSLVWENDIIKNLLYFTV